LDEPGTAKLIAESDGLRPATLELKLEAAPRRPVLASPVKADNALYLKDGRIYRHLALTILPAFDYAAFGTRWKD